MLIQLVCLIHLYIPQFNFPTIDYNWVFSLNHIMPKYCPIITLSDDITLFHNLRWVLCIVNNDQLIGLVFFIGIRLVGKIKQTPKFLYVAYFNDFTSYTIAKHSFTYPNAKVTLPLLIDKAATRGVVSSSLSSPSDVVAGGAPQQVHTQVSSGRCQHCFTISQESTNGLYRDLQSYR